MNSTKWIWIYTCTLLNLLFVMSSVFGSERAYRWNVKSGGRWRELAAVVVDIAFTVGVVC